MKRMYEKLTLTPMSVEPEDELLTGSIVKTVKMDVEVDEYVKIEDMEISFE